jgi:hypothetical protein
MTTVENNMSVRLYRTSRILFSPEFPSNNYLFFRMQLLRRRESLMRRKRVKNTPN